MSVDFAVFASQVPNATVVDEFVGLNLSVAFRAFVFEVVKRNASVLRDGGFNLAKHAFFAAQVFVVVAFDEQRALDAAVEHVA